MITAPQGQYTLAGLMSLVTVAAVAVRVGPIWAISLGTVLAMFAAISWAGKVEIR